jgi:hypothetical protein
MTYCIIHALTFRSTYAHVQYDTLWTILLPIRSRKHIVKALDNARVCPSSPFVQDFDGVEFSLLSNAVCLGANGTGNVCSMTHTVNCTVFAAEVGKECCTFAIR